MGRKPKTDMGVRVRLRIKSELLDVFNRYTPEQLSEIMNIALKTIEPDSGKGAYMPTMVRPEKFKTRTVARIKTNGRTIGIVFPEKRDDFRDVVYGLGYTWDSWRWVRTIGANVDLVDRVAETAHTLLSNGFIVLVEHTEIRDKAISGDYKPESFRLIDAADVKGYDGWFTFKWPRSEDWYKEAMSITAAKCADSRVRVPIDHFAEVEDFAEQNDFEFTSAGLKLLEQARIAWESMPVALANKKSKSKKKSNPLDDVEVTIPDALKDDIA